MLDSAAPVAPLRHASAFADYRPLEESKVGSWREANDNVGRIGGWRNYAREASAALKAEAAAAAAAASRPASPAPAGPKTN